MNPYPIFIDFECSSPDADGFPIAVSWSTPDGQIKNTLITPEEDWLDNHSPLFDDGRITPDELMLHGVSALEVIRELQSDIDSDVIYSDGAGEEEHWLDMLFDSYQMNLQFAVEPASSLYEIGSEHWLDLKHEWQAERGMDAYTAEANVVAMLHLHANLTG